MTDEMLLLANSIVDGVEVSRSGADVRVEFMLRDDNGVDDFCMAPDEAYALAERLKAMADHIMSGKPARGSV